jgi:replicative DNA helicase
MRVLTPQEELEKKLIGCIVLDPRTFSIARESICADDFQTQVPKIIFEAMCDCDAAGEELNIATIYKRLFFNEIFEKNAGIQYLVDSSHECIGAVFIEQYCNSVKETSNRRKVLAIANSLTKIANEHVDDFSSVILSMAEELGSLSESSVKLPWLTAQESVSEAMENYMKPDDGVLPTGLLDLDAKMTGLRPGSLTIIAARPAMGKTAFGLNLMVTACLNKGVPVAFFSLEMTNDELVYRLQSIMASINGSAIRRKKLNDTEWSGFLSAAEKLSDAEYYIDPTPGLELQHFLDRARRMHTQYGIKLIIIDYLQLMCSERKKNASREQEVADISRSLKGIAKKLKVPVVALAQLNRAVDTRTDKRPVLSDLRESGSIEQDADNVLFIHREDYYHPNDPPTNEAEIIIAKQRGGETGIVKLRWTGEYTRFDNLEGTEFD